MARGEVKTGSGSKYLGSVPKIVCEIWAKNCGAPVGTREWIEYAAKQLKSGDYSKFNVSA
jgi:hypothetical protein